MANRSDVEHTTKLLYVKEVSPEAFATRGKGNMHVQCRRACMMQGPLIVTDSKHDKVQHGKFDAAAKMATSIQQPSLTLCYEAFT